MRRIRVFIRCKERQDNGEIYEIPNCFSLHGSQNNDIRLERSALDSNRQSDRCTHNAILNARSPTDYCCGKAIRTTHIMRVCICSKAPVFQSVDIGFHLDTGFSCFPCVYKQMLRRFPRFQVATKCFSCSPPDLNLVVTNFIFCISVK